MEVRTTGVPVIGEKELRRAAEILRRYKQGRQNLERRIIADEDWWKLRQWRQFADKGNPNDDRPASGWLFNVIMGKHADAIAAYPGPNIRPREPDDRMEAQMLSSILPCILEQNDFEEVYSDTCWQKMKQGTGVWGVYWDQEKLGGLGDISIRPVNVLNLVWEPGVTDIQKSQNVFYLELEDNETLLAAYPQLAGKLGGSSGLLARYRTDDAVDLSEKTLVVDWYYKKRVEGRTVLHYCKYVGQTVLYATENDTFVPSVTREEVDERGERRLVQVPVRGPACERGLYDDGEYPFIFDRLFPIEGSICGYGYIDIGKGAQEQIDRMDQAIVKNTIMSATPSVPPTSPSISSYSPVTGGMSRTVTYMMTAAMAAGVRKVAMVTPMILPARFALCMLAMEEEMEQKTVGTAMQNIRFRKTVPSGSRTVAPLTMISPSASLTAGQIAPTTQPATMPVSIRIRNP